MGGVRPQLGQFLLEIGLVTYENLLLGSVLILAD